MFCDYSALDAGCSRQGPSASADDSGSVSLLPVRDISS